MNDFSCNETNVLVYKFQMTFVPKVPIAKTLALI